MPFQTKCLQKSREGKTNKQTSKQLYCWIRIEPEHNAYHRQSVERDYKYGKTKTETKHSFL